MSRKIGVVLLFLMLLAIAGCASKEAMDKKVESFTGGKIVFYYEEKMAKGFYMVCVGEKERFVITNRSFFSPEVLEVQEVDPERVSCKK